MYHILPAERQRQYGPICRKNQPLALAAANAPGLVQLGIAVIGRIGSVDQKMNLAAPSGRVDLVGAGDQHAGARLQAQPVERRLAERRRGPGGEIVGNDEIAGLERAGQRAAKLALDASGFERRMIDADPSPSPRRPRTDIGRDPAVRPQCQADQIVARVMGAGEDALALGDVARRATPRASNKCRRGVMFACRTPLHGFVEGLGVAPSAY